MSKRITIIVGTMTGTAEIVADDVLAALEDRGHAVDVLPMDDLDATVFRRPSAFLVCTSTYGQGDVPDNAQGLCEDLEAGRPDLTGVEFAVFGLGDRTYADTFCAGGRRFDEVLGALNARRLAPRFDHDAGGPGMPEEDAVAWALDWVDRVADAPAAAA